MASIHNDVFDAALQVLIDDCDELHICSQEPTTYAEAQTTYTLGNKASPTVGTLADGDVSGRKVTVSAITDGSVTGTGTATHFALVDTVGSRLLATKSLNASQAVTSGNPFTLTALDVEITDPA